MIQIAVVEDEEEYASQLIACLQRYSEERHTSFSIHSFNDGIDLMDSFQPTWDIIFLDIRMKHMDGMKTARKIRQVDPDVILIFITSMAQYSIKGYEVDASDFILKPVSYPHLAMRLDKAIRRIGKDTETYLVVNENGVRQKILSRDILYAEVKNHNIDLVLADRTITIRKTMGELEKELSEEPFCRCSNSYLVNLRHVTAFQKDTVTVNNTPIPISRTRKKPFMLALASFLGD